MSKKEVKVWGGFGEKKSNNGTQWYFQDRIYDSDFLSPALTGFKSDYWIIIRDEKVFDMDEDEKKRIKEHQCIQCDNVYYDPPHPRLKCGVDGHTALDIVGLEHCLESLYEHCPKNNGGG